MPAYHYPNNPIDTYRRQQQGQPDDDGEPPAPPGTKKKTKHEVEYEGGVSKAVVKRVEDALTTMLQYDQSQYKPRGRLGGTVLLTTVRDLAIQANLSPAPISTRERCANGE